MPGCCHNSSDSSLRFNTMSSNYCPTYKGQYSRSSSKYDLYETERELHSEATGMSRRFDREKQDLLDLVQTQQRIIDKLSSLRQCKCSGVHDCGEECRFPQYVFKNRDSHSKVEERVPLDACRPASLIFRDIFSKRRSEYKVGRNRFS